MCDSDLNTDINTVELVFQISSTLGSIKNMGELSEPKYNCNVNESPF